MGGGLERGELARLPPFLLGLRAQSTSLAGGGNALQLWGGNDKNITVHDLEADTLAGRAVETESLTAGTGIVVSYARATNAAVSPMYQSSSYLTCTDCG